MEKAHQDLQEKYSKTQEDISKMMEMLVTLTKGKWVIPQVRPILLRNANDDPP